MGPFLPPLQVISPIKTSVNQLITKQQMLNQTAGVGGGGRGEERREEKREKESQHHKAQN